MMYPEPHNRDDYPDERRCANQADEPRQDLLYDLDCAVDSDGGKQDGKAPADELVEHGAGVARTHD